MAKNKDIIENTGIEIPNGYLTLKEASERTTYTPDYIGQLIRAGKIEGKQVYSNVAWVANETSLRQYLEAKGKDIRMNDAHSGTQNAVYAAYFPLTRLARPLLYGVILITLTVFVVLMYILSVTLDRAIASAVHDEAVTTIELSNDGSLVHPARGGPPLGN